MTHTFTTDDASATLEAGRLLGTVVSGDDVVTLSGDLGAGKTVLVKGVATGLEVATGVTSPTFNILLVHEGRLTLNHFDLYRLERPEELEDIDFWGVLESGGVSVVEWGERFPEALPADHLSVSIAILDDDVRRFDIVAGGPQASRLAEAWAGALEAAT